MATVCTGTNKNNNIRPMTMACGHVGLGESSLDTVELTKKIIDNWSNYLQLWARKFDNQFVNEFHDVPNPETVLLTNLSDSTNTIDACDQACKSLRLPQKSVIDTQSNYKRKITL